MHRSYSSCALEYIMCRICNRESVKLFVMNEVSKVKQKGNKGGLVQQHTVFEVS